MGVISSSKEGGLTDGHVFYLKQRRMDGFFGIIEFHSIFIRVLSVCVERSLLQVSFLQEIEYLIHSG